MELMENANKQNEIGTIPFDWVYRQIGDEIDLLTGHPFPSDRYVDNGVRLLRGSNVKRGNTDWSDEITKYWEKLTPDLNQYVLNEGDIVIAMDGSLVGKSFARLTKKDLPAILLQRVARIRSNKIDLGYLKEFICSDYFTKHCDSVKTISAIPHISPKDIRSFIIPVPSSRAEQTAIATALSDIDVLIENLEKLIAKKQRIKQGVLQELLTGKKRLIGFDRKWEKVNLGDLGKTYGGLSGKTKSDFQNGNSPYIPFLNILNNPIIDPDYLDYVNIRLEESQNKAQKGDLFFNGSSETPEEVGMCSILMDDIPTLYLNSFCFGFRLFNQENSNGLFLTYYFRSLEGRKLIYSLAQGATRYNLSKTNFLKTELRIPDPGEQSAIASIIKDVDDEIGILNKNFNKLHMIKRGMMQSLLTGKIRLI